MSTALILRAYFLTGVLMVILLPVTWWLVPKWRGHRRWNTPELQLKSESEMRRDATHAVLGLGAIFSVLLSVATYVQSVEKEKSDRKAALIAQLDSPSVATQSEALHQLNVIWEAEEPDAVLDHYRVLRSFLQSHAERKLKTGVKTMSNLNDLQPVERNRPSIESALVTLSQVNRRHAVKSDDDRLIFKDLDLRFLDLRGFDFHGIDFSSCVFTGSILNGSQMSGAKLHDAWLQGTDLSDTTLVNAAFNSSHLGGGTNFSNANIEGADFQAANSEIPELPVSAMPRGSPKNVTGWKFVVRK